MTDKPDLTKVWAENADPTDIKNPDTDEAGKFQKGWLTEVPPHTWFNYIQNNFSAALAHFNEYGIAQWDTDTVYPVGAWARSTVDGYVYFALSAQSGNEPSASPTHWKSLNVELKSGRKNYLINGNFDVWQRGASFIDPAFAAEPYTADRWAVESLPSLGGAVVISLQANSYTDPNLPDSAKNFLRFSTSSVSSGNQVFQQRVEGVNSLAGEIVTVSFLAKSAQSIEIQDIIFQQVFGAGGSAMVTTELTSSFSLSPNWEKYVFTVFLPDVQNKTINDSSYLNLNIRRTISGVGDIGDFDIAQVQLEKGSYATDFEYRPVAEELALCQGYTMLIGQYSVIGTGYAVSATTAAFVIPLPTSMRVVPTFLGGSYIVFSGTAANSATITNITKIGTNVLVEVATTGLVANAPCILRCEAGNLILDAEL